jgi:acetyl esterase
MHATSQPPTRCIWLIMWGRMLASTQSDAAAKEKTGRGASMRPWTIMRQWTIFAWLVTLSFWCSAASAQISNLPEDIQKRLSEINPSYQSDIGKYARETLQLFAPLLATEPKDGVNVVRDEAYCTDPKQRLDVYQPQGANNLPIVVYFHGGALTAGDKNDPHAISTNATSEISANALYYFARHGFLGVNANYRLAPEHVYPAAAQDIGGVVAWLKANAKRFGGNPARIYLVGRSAGALHVATWAFDPEIHGAGGPGVAGVVLISGRLKADSRADDPNGSRVPQYFGPDASLYPERSPVNFGAQSTLPTFIVVAEFDNPFLDVYGAELFAKMCAARSRCPRFLRLVGHNHQSSTASLNTADDLLGQEIIDFIRQGQ